MRCGEVAVGVRVDDAALLAALRAAFAPQLVDLADPPAYLSVQRNRDGGVGLLHEGGFRLLRTRDPRRLAHGVAVALAEAAGAPPPPSGWVRLGMIAVVAGDAAVLLPSSRRGDVDDARTSLARAGATPADGCTCAVDPVAGVVRFEPPPGAEALAQALAAHGIGAGDAAEGRSAARELSPPRGRFALRAVLDGGEPSPASRAGRIAERVIDAGGGSRLAAAVRLVERVPCQPAPASGAPALRQAVVAALAGGEASPTLTLDPRF